MSYLSKYNPDYAKVYPGVEMSPEQLAAAKKYDREFRRIDHDLKRGRPIYANNTTGQKTDRHDPDRIEVDEEPGHEVSLDAMLEGGEKAVTGVIDEYADPFTALWQKERCTELYRCLKRLAPEERDLINALFYKEMTEKQYADTRHISQQAVNKAKNSILRKLKKIFWAK
jgi:RNA polymerase sigma factor (sigma-70 family)